MPSNLTLRPANQQDCVHLVLFADMATRRLTSYVWGLMATPGQSSFEVGRNIIRNDDSHVMRLGNWRVAEEDGKIIGGLNSYVISEPSSSPASTLNTLKPLNELKEMAIGTWYISALAVYLEHQGSGVGKALLAEAESLARAANMNRLTLMVGSFNARAYDVYQQAGFKEWARRPFIAFPGSDEPGEWILMVKNLG